MTHLTEERISAYVDGAMTIEERQSAAGHVVDCTTCSAAVRQLHTMRGLIRSLPVADPDPWFADRMEALAMGEERVDLLWLGPERVAARAVVGLALLVAGLVLGLVLRTDTPPTVPERYLALGVGDTTSQLLLSASELSTDDVLLAAMAGE
ncbi:MAG: hypothetical protein AABY75_07870 [Bacteroidota bacterium]